jgi:hypothetical protein
MSGVRSCLFALALAATDRVSEPLSARAQLEVEPAGPHCPEGGLAARFGLDLDRDGALSPSEIELTSYVCPGRSGSPSQGSPSQVGGLDALLGLSEVPVRGYCVAGGLSVSAGLDLDGDHQLDEAEITDVEHLCFGAG